MGYSAAFARGIRPEKQLGVSEWADTHRMLSSKTSLEPGQWRTSRTPYLRDIMDALSPDHPCRKVSAMMGAQLGKTESGNNWVGYVVDHTPGPMMVVQPTVELAKRYSKGRLDTVFSDSPKIEKKIEAKRSRTTGNTVLQKYFEGGTIVITGANSAVGLRSIPVRFLFRDEIDAYPGDVEEEGDPLSLSEARTRNFGRSAKIFDTSTPTIQGRSKIEAEFEDGDQSRFYLPCPLCGHMQTLKMISLEWENDDPATVVYRCEECEETFGEHYKTQMLADGVWMPEHPERSSTHRSFHLNSLYSPLGWYSWQSIVADWLKAQENVDKLRAFNNTVLAETWRQRGDAPVWEDLYNRRESYPMGVVPAKGCLLVAGVDVQKNRLEAEVVAYGEDMESWSVEYMVMMGDPNLDEVWRQLDEQLVDRTFDHANGHQMRVRGICIDTGGHWTQEVYRRVREKAQPSRIFAVKGREGTNTLIGIPTPVDVVVSGRRIRRGLSLWMIDVAVGKQELYGWLNMKQPIDAAEVGYPPGWCHFPEYPDEYFKGLTAEELTPVVRRGFRRWQWEKIRERNEPLDCRVYARCAAAILGADRMRPEDWQKLRRSLSSGPPNTAKAPAKKKKRKGPKWMDR